MLSEITIIPIETRCGPRNGTTIMNANDLSHQISRSIAITTLQKKSNNNYIK